MNVTDFVNLVINSLKSTGKGTGAIKDNGDGTQSAVILTFKDNINGDVFDFGNGNTSDINDVPPQRNPSGNEQNKTDNEKKPTHIASMEDVNTNYYEKSIKEQTKEEAKKETQNNKNSTSSGQSWFNNILDMMTNLINNIITMLTEKSEA